MADSLNYSVWRDEHKAILEDLKDKCFLMTYSGGKDSSLILHFIQKAADEFGFNFETHAVPFPAYVLTADEIEKLNGYWQERGIRIIWHPVPVSDEKLKDALEREISPCTICNQTKKRVLIQFFKESQLALDQTVIIINYSLWDLVSATVEHILGGIYRDEKEVGGFKGKTPKERFIETSQRFYPLLTINRGLNVFKPLIKYNDQDILQAMKTYRIPVTSKTCRFHEYRPKRWFAKYYHAMGLRYDYESVLAFAKEALQLPEKSYFEQIDLKKYLRAVF
jgi:tRNA(Ile)-lysidine synthase TilS/MesJ